MRRPLLLSALCLLLPATAAAQATTTTTGAVAAVPPGGGRVVADIGWLTPLGDLSDGLDATPTGVGARPGFEIGLEWRFALARSWFLAPTGHFLGYGDATGLGATGELSLAPSSLRYGVEAMYSPPRAGTQWFVAVAPAHVRSYLKGPGKDHVTLIDAGTGGWGLSARAGLRFGDTELSVIYHVNRFRSFGFFGAGEELSYDWDSAALRLGWRLP